MINIDLDMNVGKPICFVFTDTEKRDGKEIGHILISSLGNGYCMVWNVYVWPKQRRKRYGTMMVKFLQGELPENCCGLLRDVPWSGYEKIVTQWNATPKESKMMLEKCGFERKGNLLLWERSNAAA